ncbi:Cu-binding protein [Tieghemiomyces parasiticus]|uniref:Cu-binding protein n=1 Tax=Tieghemiomyces parasiticus TaxID=78921 RepID=A0A9W8E2Y2_9FUNG|nr:Cu-binding protein [Tieghemiomyces parasiticus]
MALNHSLRLAVRRWTQGTAPLPRLAAAARPALPPRTLPLLHATTRTYTTTTPLGEEPSGPNREGRSKERAHLGPFSPIAAILFLGVGAAMYAYLNHEKERIKQEKATPRADEVVGKPRIGGPFALTDHHGKPATDQDFRGRFMLVYFGFTHCPDICPEELDKMADVLTRLEKDDEVDADDIVPIFITCDPQRDGVAEIREYVRDFHPRLIGLTGDYEDVNKTARAYRVYFSKPPTAQPGEDYLVDHSIFFYLMDPRGEFVDAFGRDRPIDEVFDKIKGYLKEEKATHSTKKE